MIIMSFFSCVVSVSSGESNYVDRDEKRRTSDVSCRPLPEAPPECSDVLETQPNENNTANMNSVSCDASAPNSGKFAL